ncbi:MAG: hypothetical protein H0V89_10150 [Deltaproteobacteria bacterium]|nr:hypothetical protein [Deltaproteobacteria bacterium]
MLAFSHELVRRLLDTKRLEIRPGTTERVIWLLSQHLLTQKRGASLISALSAALLSFPEVEELYADDEELRDLVTDLGL